MQSNRYTADIEDGFSLTALILKILICKGVHILHKFLKSFLPSRKTSL